MKNKQLFSFIILLALMVNFGLPSYSLAEVGEGLNLSAPIAVRTCNISDPLACVGQMAKVFLGGAATMVGGIGGTIAESADNIPIINSLQSSFNDFKKVVEMGPLEIFYEILGALFRIFGALISFEILIVSFLLSPDTFQYATSPAVQAGFYVCLQLANGLLAIGMVILANKFILGMESYGNLKSLSKYLVTALLINFSLMFCSYAIGLSNFLTIAFLNASVAPQGAPTSAIARSVAIQNQFAQMFSGVAEDYGCADDQECDTFSSVAISLVLVLVSILIILILAAMIVSFLMRVIFLWLYMMVVPLAYASETVFSGFSIPGMSLSGQWNTWLKGFVKWISFGPIMAGVLWFTMLIMNAFLETGTIFNAQGDLAIILNSFQRILGPIAALVLLYQGYEFAHSSSSGVPGFVDKAIQSTISYDKGALTIMGRNAATEFKNSFSKIGGTFANSGVGKMLQNRAPAFISNPLSKAAEKRRDLNKESIKEGVSYWARRYENARNDKERQLVLEQASSLAAGTPILKGKAGRIVRPDDMAEAFQFVMSNSDGRELHAKTLAKNLAGRKGEQLENSVQKINDWAKQRGASGQVKVEDLYAFNPLLAIRTVNGKEDKSAMIKYANRMSVDDLAALDKDKIVSVLPYIANASTLLKLVEKTAGDPDKSGMIMKTVEDKVISSTALTQSWQKSYDVGLILENLSATGSGDAKASADKLLAHLRSAEAKKDEAGKKKSGGGPSTA